MATKSSIREALEEYVRREKKWHAMGGVGAMSMDDFNAIGPEHNQDLYEKLKHQYED